MKGPRDHKEQVQLSKLKLFPPQDELGDEATQHFPPKPHFKKHVESFFDCTRKKKKKLFSHI